MRAAIQSQMPSLDLPLGQRYTVRIAPARAEAPNGFLKSLVLPDGGSFAYPGPAAGSGAS
jgi:hypothetical protein